MTGNSPEPIVSCRTSLTWVYNIEDYDKHPIMRRNIRKYKKKKGNHYSNIKVKQNQLFSCLSWSGTLQQLRMNNIFISDILFSVRSIEKYIHNFEFLIETLLFLVIRGYYLFLKPIVQTDKIFSLLFDYY